MCPSVFVASTAIRRYTYFRCGVISFSSLYLSCHPLLVEDFDHYLPSFEFLFSVWEWFLQHTASLIYLKIQGGIIGTVFKNMHTVSKVKNFSPFSAFCYNRKKAKEFSFMCCIASSLERTSTSFFFCFVLFL